MKKVIVFSLILITSVVLLASCSPSRKGTGCPMTDGIIH